MFPEQREYRVGPSGLTVKSPDGRTSRYEPGALVWLQAAPQGADLQPTGERRRYETKVVKAREAKRARLSNKELKVIIAAQDQAAAQIKAGMSYVVGEHGPETFVPSASGQIVPERPE